MGQKNLLRIDPYSDAVANPEYFYPLTLHMEVSEKQKFIQYVDQTFYKQTARGHELVSPVSDVKKFFPLTIKNTNEFYQKYMDIIVNQFVYLFNLLLLLYLLNCFITIIVIYYFYNKHNIINIIL